MSETLTFVYLQHANSQAQLVGRSYTHERRGHEIDRMASAFESAG